MKKNKLQISTIMVVLIAVMACNFPTYTHFTGKNTVQQPFAVLTPDPNATPTPTPFLPEAPTETFIPTEADTPTPQPTPLPEAYFEGGAARIPQPADQVSVLILGSDTRNDGSFRTDVIMLAVFNRISGKVSLVSFPRDLYLLLPGYENQRINTAQEFGGFDLTQKTFEYNFGIHPDHYIMTNFSGFKQIIDTLGGVDIDAARTFTDHCDIPGVAERVCSVEAGKNHLDAEMALWYVRSRYSTSDFDRLRRTQEVVQGILKKLLSLDVIARSPQIFAQFINSVETDMKLADLLPFLPLIVRLNEPGKLKKYELTAEGGQVTSWVEPSSGANLLLPNAEPIREVLLEAYSQ
jgi:LCP family protein required for cell wall assembly